MAITEEDWQKVKTNLFPGALPAIKDRQTFLWHTDRHNRPYTHQANSSQSLAIDVFGTMMASPDVNAICGRIAEEQGMPTMGPWTVELEWQEPHNLLREPRPSQIDAIAQSPSAIMTFECKFTEAHGGHCSQPNTVKVRTGTSGSGDNATVRQCNGNFAEQENPYNGKHDRCALRGKGIRYWDVIPSILGYPNDVDFTPCPFAGAQYQWMRNLAVCSELARTKGLKGACAVVYVDAPHLPMAKYVKSVEWADLQKRAAAGPVPLVSLPYSVLVRLAAEASMDKNLWQDLADWIERKIALSLGCVVPLSKPDLAVADVIQVSSVHRTVARENTSLFP